MRNEWDDVLMDRELHRVQRKALDLANELDLLNFSDMHKVNYNNGKVDSVVSEDYDDDDDDDIF